APVAPPGAGAEARALRPAHEAVLHQAIGMRCLVGTNRRNQVVVADAGQLDLLIRLGIPTPRALPQHEKILHEQDVGAAAAPGTGPHGRADVEKELLLEIACRHELDHALPPRTGVAGSADAASAAFAE